MLEVLLDKNPKAFVRAIEEALGDRLRRLKRDDDQFQIFWLGVITAVPRMEVDRDEVGFLISSGYGAVKNFRRAENTRRFFAYCPVCGIKHSFRTKNCKVCGHDLLIDLHESKEEPSYIPETLENKYAIEQFVKTLPEGNQKKIAKRWLVDRADLFYVNHLKQIGAELGISAPAVAKHKKQIQEKFLRFYNS